MGADPSKTNSLVTIETEQPKAIFWPPSFSQILPNAKHSTNFFPMLLSIPVFVLNRQKCRFAFPATLAPSSIRSQHLLFDSAEITSTGRASFLSICCVVKSLLLSYARSIKFVIDSPIFGCTRTHACTSPSKMRDSARSAPLLALPNKVQCAHDLTSRLSRDSEPEQTQRGLGQLQVHLLRSPALQCVD